MKQQLPVDLPVANARRGYLRTVTLTLAAAALWLMPATAMAQAQQKNQGSSASSSRGTEIVVAKHVQGPKRSAASQRAVRGAAVAANARLRAEKARGPKAPRD